MKIVDCKQGTAEWLKARAGVFTASDFDNLMTMRSAAGSRLRVEARVGDTPQTYMLRKIAERCMGFPLEQPGSWATEQGAVLEAEAIPWLEFTHNLSIERVGFVTSDDGRIGCSPDGLIGEDGGVEIKCPQPVNHLKYLLSDGVPRDYLAQVHGSLYVTGRKWWMFVSYSRQFPPLLVRVERDEKIMAAIDGVLQAALKDFEAKLAQVRALKQDYDAPRIAAGEKKHADELAKMRAAAPGGELPGERWAREYAERGA